MKLRITTVTLILAVTCAAQSVPLDDLAANPVYQKNCARCHGKTAEGRHFGGPSLSSEKATSDSSDNLRGIISKGRGHMPKFSDKLSSSDIDSLVRQIKAMNVKE